MFSMSASRSASYPSYSCRSAAISRTETHSERDAAPRRRRHRELEDDRPREPDPLARTLRRREVEALEFDTGAIPRALGDEGRNTARGRGPRDFGDSVEQVVEGQGTGEAPLVIAREGRQGAQGRRTRRRGVRILQLERELVEPQRSQIWLHRLRKLHERVFDR
jgi:hypothetical protein